MANVTEKNGWLRINDLKFFGRYNKSSENDFKVAFSDGHFTKNPTGMEWTDGRVILMQGDIIVWAKTTPRPLNASVASNGNVVLADLSFKPSDHRVGSSLTVFDSKGDTLLRHQFEFNVNDCVIMNDGKTCLVNTLYPDNTLYAIDVSS